MPRTKIVISVVLSLVVALLLRIGTAAQEATPGTAESAPVEVLFVQTFAAGQLMPAGAAGVATLTLEQPVGQTVYFAEHPNRGAGTIALADLLQVLWQDATDPPNAALVIDRTDGADVVIVELLSGIVDAAGTVTFDVRVLPDPGEVGEPIEFGGNQLFVDGASCNPIIDPNCLKSDGDPIPRQPVIEGDCNPGNPGHCPPSAPRGHGASLPNVDLGRVGPLNFGVVVLDGELAVP